MRRKKQISKLATLAVASFFISTAVAVSPAVADGAHQSIDELLARSPADKAITEGNVQTTHDGGSFDVTGWSGATISIDIGADSEPIVTARGTLVYDMGNDAVTVPQRKEDGSVQILNVIESASAPTSFNYELTLPSGAGLVPDESGAVLILAEDGTYLGAVAAPWAVDAEGRSVATSFEVEGRTITQAINHTAGNHVYPVIADPWLGVDLVQVPYVTFPSEGYRINVKPTKFGEGLSTPFYIHTWWAHKDEVVSKLGISAWRWTTSIQEQFYCHLGGYPFGLPEYNMESWRPLVYWETSLLSYGCNP